MDTSKVTRVEVIDENWRAYINFKSNNSVSISLQDDDRTIKVFISQIENEPAGTD